MSAYIDYTIEVIHPTGRIVVGDRSVRYLKTAIRGNSLLEALLKLYHEVSSIPAVGPVNLKECAEQASVALTSGTYTDTEQSVKLTIEFKHMA
jgi:hypothetical protein